MIGRIIVVVFALVVLAVGVGPAACTRDTCSVDPRTPGEPVPAIECGSGDLCYRGQCVAACTAGQEGTESCESDSDCGGARPRCVNRACSACQTDERCIPVLDICEVVSAVPLPDEPPLPPEGTPRPPQPRDAGVLDGGLIRPGVEQPDAGQVDLPLTRSVFIDLARSEVLAGAGASGDSFEVRAYDVSDNLPGLNWRVDRTPPAIEETLEADPDCDLNVFRAPDVAPTPAPFGTLRVDDFNSSGALAGELVATWDEARSLYAVMPSPLPQPTITLSDFATLDSTFVTVTGSRVTDVTETTWPATERGLHVPFDLRAEPSTRMLLSEPIVLGAQPRPVLRDLDLLFERVGTGVVATERILVRIPGTSHELLCQQSEGPGADNRVIVRAGLLERFRDLEGAPAGAEYPLILERASAERFSVEPDAKTPNLRFFVSARVRHSLQGVIVF